MIRDIGTRIEGVSRQKMLLDRDACVVLADDVGRDFSTPRPLKHQAIYTPRQAAI